MMRLIILITILLVLAVPGRAQEDAERSRFITYVEQQLSTPDRIIRLNGLQGVLSSDVRLTSITIADSEGIWLTLDDVQLVWNRSALLRGRLDIDRLAAQSVTVLRKPNPGESAPSMQARDIAIPELPVALHIGALQINRVNLKSPVLGFDAVLSVDGHATLDAETADLDLTISRLDGTRGGLSIDVDYRPVTERLIIDTQLSEPEGGIIATALGIPDQPALDLTIAGDGVVNDLDVQVLLRAEGRDVFGGTVRTSAMTDATQLVFDLDGPLAQIMPANIAALLGKDNQLAGRAIFANDGAINIEELRLDGGVLQASGQLSRSNSGLINEANLTAQLRPTDGRITIVLPGQSGTTIEAASVDLSFDANARQALQLRFDANKVQSASTSTDQLVFGMIGTLSDPGPERSLAFDGRGQALGIRLPDPKLAAAIGPQVTFSLSGLLPSNGEIQLDTISVAARDLTVQGAGSIAGPSVRGQAELVVNTLSNLAALVELDAKGSGRFALNGDANLLTGAFDLKLDGNADTTVNDNEVIAGLLAGSVSINGRLARSIDGTVFDTVSIKAPNAQINADGVLSPERTNLTAGITITELERISGELGGVGRAQIDIAGNAPDYEIKATATIPDGRVSGQRTQDLSIGFSGIANANQLAGDLEASGALGSQPVTLDGQLLVNESRAVLDGFVAAIGEAQLNGALTRRGDTGLLTGTIGIAADDIAPLAALTLQPASGQVTADIVLTPQAGKQNINIDATLRDIRYRDVKVNRANASLAITDALANAGLNGVLDAQGLSTPELSIASIGGQATTTGTQTRFEIRSNGFAAEFAENFGISPFDLNANGTLDRAANLVRLTQLDVRNTQDIAVTGQGTLPLSGNGASLLIDGQAPLSIAQTFLKSRGTSLSGLARFNLSLSGSITQPKLSGLLSLNNAIATDPLANIALDDINLLAGFEGDTVSINSFNAAIGEGGRLSGGGRIELSANQNADLSLSLSDVPYSDGQSFATTINADLRLTGPLALNPDVTGIVNLGRTEIMVPETVGAAANLLRVQHVRPDNSTAQTLSRIASLMPAQSQAEGTSAINLNVTVNAPSQIFVRGRGMDAELAGSVTLRGTTSNVVPTGGFSLRRGRLDILAQRIDFETGQIVLAGNLDPFLDFRAVTQTGDITAIIALRGQPSDLDISFSSDPELPEDEVVAQILFGRAISTLSPVQILRLAAAISELTGEDGLNLVGLSRDILGIDDLDIVEDDQGNAAVRAGTYINDRIYLGVEAGQQTEATINIDITDSLTARGSAASDGESKLGVFFERDY